MPKNEDIDWSTWEILVIPPFLAALLIPALPEPPKMKKIRDEDASPHLFPTGLEVAVIGVVVEQLAHIAAETIAAANNLIAFFIIKNFFHAKYPLAFG